MCLRLDGHRLTTPSHWPCGRGGEGSRGEGSRGEGRTGPGEAHLGSSVCAYPRVWSSTVSLSISETRLSGWSRSPCGMSVGGRRTEGNWRQVKPTRRESPQLGGKSWGGVRGGRTSFLLTGGSHPQLSAVLRGERSCHTSCTAQPAAPTSPAVRSRLSLFC